VFPTLLLDPKSRLPSSWLFSSKTGSVLRKKDANTTPLDFLAAAKAHQKKSGLEYVAIARYDDDRSPATSSERIPSLPSLSRVLATPPDGLVAVQLPSFDGSHEDAGVYHVRRRNSPPSPSCPPLP
jgi:hypothetical protein